MKKVVLRFFVVLLYLSVASIVSAQVLQIQHPYVLPDNQNHRQEIRELVARAGQLVLGADTPDFGQIRYGRESWSGSSPESRQQYQLSMGVTDTGDTYLIQLSMTGPRGSSEPLIFYQRARDTNPRELAQALRYLKAASDQFSQSGTSPAPTIVEELDLSVIKLRDIQGAVLSSNSVNVLPTGEFLLGAGSLALKFSESFELLETFGQSLIADGQYAGFFQTSISNAGVLYSRTAADRFVYQFLPGTNRPRRIQLPVQLPSHMAVLRDGTLVVTDAYGGPSYRVVDGQPQPITLTSGFATAIMAVESGPDGNIWIYESVTGSLRILTPTGNLVDLILPRIPSTDRSGLRGLGIYEDGSFVMVGPSGLYSFDRSGALIWKLDSLGGSTGGPFGSIYRLSVDSENGYIYLPTFPGGRIYRLVDKSYRNRVGLDLPAQPELENLLAAARSAGSADAYADLARHYEEQSSLLLAKHNWNLALDADPFFFEAEEALRAIELAELIQQGDRAAAQTIAELETYGVETARARYQLAIRLYEQAAALDGSSSAQQKKQELENRFETAQNPNRRSFPIRIDSASLQDIFPSLIYTYRELPAGRVKITNTQSVPITNIRAQVRFAEYMDLPKDSPGPAELAPGQSAEFDLFISLNQKSLELDENLPLLVSVELSYTAEGTEQTIQRSFGTNLLKRTALSWDDSRKLAAFVTPNEAEVSGFARRLLAETDSELAAHIPAGTASFMQNYRALRQAFLLANGLGAYRVQYIEDPASPFAQNQTSAAVVDTVRFPRETLFYQSGDCDDTTALLATLFESVGIQAAILTSPGHVFLAFNSRIPATEAWLLESEDYAVIEHGGELWIPMESTNLPQGFSASWAHASRLVRQHRGGDNFEFLPIAEAREDYPALPLPRSSFSVVPPSEESAFGVISQAGTTLHRDLYTNKEASLSREVQSASAAASSASGPAARSRKREQLVAMNKLAIFYDVFSNSRQAEAAYQSALTADPSFLPTSVNLSGFYLRQNQPAKALEAAARADSLRPGSTIVVALRTQALAALGRTGEARTLYAGLAQQDPTLAESLAYLGLGDGATGSRASEAQATAPLLFRLDD